MSQAECELLLEKARNSLQAAKLLIENNLADIAVTRAYYTMFYCAQAFLLSKNLSFSSHSAVISAFGREFVKIKAVPVQYHRFLIDAQMRRNEADYDFNPNIALDEVERLIEQAGEILDFARQYFG